MAVNLGETAPLSRLKDIQTVKPQPQPHSQGTKALRKNARVNYAIPINRQEGEDANSLIHLLRSHSRP